MYLGNIEQFVRKYSPSVEWGLGPFDFEENKKNLDKAATPRLRKALRI